MLTVNCHSPGTVIGFRPGLAPLESLDHISEDRELLVAHKLLLLDKDEKPLHEQVHLFPVSRGELIEVSPPQMSPNAKQSAKHVDQTRLKVLGKGLL